MFNIVPGRHFARQDRFRIFSATRRLAVVLLYIFSRERDSSAKIQFPALTRVPFLRKISRFQLRGKLSVGLSVARYKTARIIDNGTNSAREIRSDPSSFSRTLMGFANASRFILVDGDICRKMNICKRQNFLVDIYIFFLGIFYRKDVRISAANSNLN